MYELFREELKISKGLTLLIYAIETNVILFLFSGKDVWFENKK